MSSPSEIMRLAAFPSDAARLLAWAVLGKAKRRRGGTMC